MGYLIVPPSPGIVGSSNITDLRDGPPPPDHFAFSARRRSIALLGDIIIYHVFSAFHPGNINGKVMSIVGQRVALWPDLPHEKHFTSDKSCCTGRCLNCWFGIYLPSKKVCNLVSNFVGSVGAGKTGFLAAAFSIRSCTNLSNTDGSGALAVEVAPGVSISTNFLSSSCHLPSVPVYLLSLLIPVQGFF